MIVVLIDHGSAVSKFFECLQPELEIEQEYVTSFFDTFVCGNRLIGLLSYMSTCKIRCWKNVGAGLSNFDEHVIKVLQFKSTINMQNLLFLENRGTGLSNLDEHAIGFSQLLLRVLDNRIQVGRVL